MQMLYTASERRLNRRRSSALERKRGNAYPNFTGHRALLVVAQDDDIQANLQEEEGNWRRRKIRRNRKLRAEGD